MSTGKVMVERPTDSSVRPQVEIIDGTSLQLVATSECDQEIELEEGTYLVSTTLPGGERSVGVAQVESGQTAVVKLQPPASAIFPEAVGVDIVAAPAPAMAAPEAEMAMPEAPRSAFRKLLRRERKAPPPPAPPPPPPAAEWFLRFHVLAPGSAPAAADPRVDVVRADPSGAELLVGASGDGLLLAQVARPGEVPLNVMLPIYGPTISQSCRMTLGADGDGSTASVSLPDSPLVDAVARYLHTGHLKEATDTIKDAESLLQQKMADPFGAALGAYALLRLGQLERLHHWPRNLAAWFEWLPDGAVIAAEEAALEGDHATALTGLCEGARRGLPVFADGLSLLTSRLRDYAGSDPAASKADPALVQEAAGHLERLMPYMPFVDFARISLAFRAGDPADPAGSQTPFGGERRDGWARVDELGT